MVDLRAKPYGLSEEDIAWVEKTIAGMTDEEKVGQLFFDNNGGASDEELRDDYIIPQAFDPRVGPAVAKAVAEAARKSGVARI